MAHAVETVGSFPETEETLAILDEALRKRPAKRSRRVVATDDSQSAEEGLAILRCYVAILDRQVRQAILDVLVRTADVDPHA